MLKYYNNKFLDEQGDYMKKVLKIKQILENRGLKQKWLADKIGVTEVTISNWVNNRTYPSIETLLTISTVLNIEVKDLFE